MSYLARMVIKLAEFRVEGPDRMEMPQGVRCDHVEGLSALIAPISPLDACLHRPSWTICLTLDAAMGEAIPWPGKT